MSRPTGLVSLFRQTETNNRTAVGRGRGVGVGLKGHVCVFRLPFIMSSVHTYTQYFIAEASSVHYAPLQWGIGD